MGNTWKSRTIFLLLILFLTYCCRMMMYLLTLKKYPSISQLIPHPLMFKTHNIIHCFAYLIAKQLLSNGLFARPLLIRKILIANTIWRRKSSIYESINIRLKNCVFLRSLLKKVIVNILNSDYCFRRLWIIFYCIFFKSIRVNIL